VVRCHFFNFSSFCAALLSYRYLTHYLSLELEISEGATKIETISTSMSSAMLQKKRLHEYRKNNLSCNNLEKLTSHSVSAFVSSKPNFTQHIVKTIKKKPPYLNSTRFSTKTSKFSSWKQIDPISSLHW
jgi:hypothetical protein